MTANRFSKRFSVTALMIVLIASVIAAGPPLTARSPRLTPKPAFSTSGAVNVTDGDVSKHTMNELSLIVTPLFSRSVRHDIDVGICAYMRWDNALLGPPDGVDSKIWVASTSQFTVGWNIAQASGGGVAGPLPLQGMNPGQIDPFTSTGDPAVAANSLSAGTFNPRRTYVVGRMFNSRAEDQITVWYNDGAPSGQWSAYPGFATNIATSSYKVDKPAIAVSENANSSGDVYVALVQSPQTDSLSNPSPYPYSIQFWRLDAASNAWTLISTPAVGTSGDVSPRRVPQTPRLDIDQTTGTIYLSWLDWGPQTNTLNVMVSSNRGGSWAGPFTYSTGQLLTQMLPPSPSNQLCTPDKSKCVGSQSFLASRWSPADNAVALVYHRRKGTYGAEVVMRRFRYSGGLADMTAERVVSSRTGGDQWHGTVACDGSGNCVVSYYDYDHSDLTAVKYTVWARKVFVDGTAITGDTAVSSFAPSDPTKFKDTNIEYADISYRSGTWYPGFLYETLNDPHRYSNVYVAPMQ